MVKVIDWFILVNSFTFIMAFILVVSDREPNKLMIVAVMCSMFALGRELIQERMKMKKIEDILNKVKEGRGMSWDESL